MNHVHHLEVYSGSFTPADFIFLAFSTICIYNILGDKMSVIKCSHCGKDLPSEAKFCPYCMERISEPVAVELPKDKKKLNEKSIIIIIISLILALLLLVGTAIFIHFKNNADNNHNNSTTEDTNTTDKSSTENTTDDVLNFDSNKSTQENPTDNMPTEKEDETSITNIENTSSTTNATTSTTAPATNKVVTECEHNWVEITKTVHHDEIGHYETVEKQRKVTKYKCPVCYEKFTSLENYYEHFDNEHKPSYDGDPIKAFRNQYTTESGYEYYEEQKWVVDKKAYDETVVIGYKCSICEEEKEK